MPSARGSSRSRRLKNDINVVPYIDVMLVLLVIFMVTAPMITPGLIELPTVGSANEIQAKPVEVQIEQDGAISLRVRDAGEDFAEINSASLVTEVRSRITADTPVIIAADGRVPYETVMKVMDELRASGIQRLGLLVDQSAAPKPVEK
ncbi:protein TolR [Pollutimonas thiosulfatoxidans]|uniref:Protein TolR n=1 Tax=Pollutimonas thiosulfatoxidans TaxID=2028345 RepID=A0A410GCT0_9BURK|nr:protein TolR [Pollutimonas thiosulfatoxidans]MBF6616794.1 protein TolR [Candidimonas sp.]QAA94108.1 protein TolR [Pollutimonas thiosulfatoxidans]